MLEGIKKWWREGEIIRLRFEYQDAVYGRILVPFTGNYFELTPSESEIMKKNITDQLAALGATPPPL